MNILGVTVETIAAELVMAVVTVTVMIATAEIPAIQNSTAEVEMIAKFEMILKNIFMIEIDWIGQINICMIATVTVIIAFIDLIKTVETAVVLIV